MTDLKAQFEQAQKDIKTLTTRPGNGDMLALYSLFKQGSQGDASGKRPGMLDMIGRAKYDAWAKHQGTDKDEAMQQYIAKVNSLLGG